MLRFKERKDSQEIDLRGGGGSFLIEKKMRRICSFKNGWKN